MRYIFKSKEFQSQADWKKKVIRAYNMDTNYFIGYVGRRDNKFTVVADFQNAIDFNNPNNDFSLDADNIELALNDLMSGLDVTDMERDQNIVAILTL